ncbi:ankyrin repeat-containing protein [Tanacetum coccineum]
MSGPTATKNNEWKASNADPETLTCKPTIQPMLQHVTKSLTPPVKSMNMADSLKAIDASEQREELMFMLASNVNVSNFVTEKLSGPRNYAMWKAQMLCLMESQKMRGIVELDQKWPWPGAMSVNMAKQYEILLKDSSPSDDYMMPVLEDIKIELGSSTDTSRSRKLVEATLKGTWWEAKAILQNHKEAFIEGLDHCGNTMLHIAVAQGHNYFVEKLLNFIEDGEQVETINSNGLTALHIASFFDNRYAAELLVKKRKELIILDSYKGHLPLHTAFHNMKLSTYVYLLEVHEKEGRHLPLERYPREDVQTGIAILVDAIFRKRYDLGLSLAKIYPELVVKDDQVLMAMAIAFPNKLGFWETLIDPFPIATLAGPIKNIEKKKKEYKEAKELLHLIRDKMAIENKYQSYNSNHERPIFEAVRQGAHEVVKVIIPSSEAALNYINEEGHNVIQFAITNRSEKIYNYLYPRIEGRYSYIRMTDSSTNNLLHLAGRLAPPFVISRTRGAALQLQRELQWREEVYKLLLPTYRSKKNAVDETPAMVFTREHADLLKEGERWIKTTAESCSITAALIVTIVFAAAITVPGGSNQDTGIPLFKRNIAFIIFAALDAVSLFSAATDTSMFYQSYNTLREKDFMDNLPNG